MDECSWLQACSNAEINEFVTTNGGWGPVGPVSYTDEFDWMRGVCSENEACRRVFAIVFFCNAAEFDCTMYVLLYVLC